jgi:phage terminase small subunit
MGLTRKQKRFIEEYTVDFNATQAAIRAGYSERTARAIGSENLTKPDIEAAIQERINNLAMKADEVFIRLSDMARADVGDFMDIESMSFNLSLEKAKELGLTHLIKKVKQRTTITQKKDGDEEEQHWIEIELHDSQSALDKLARIHGAYNDKFDITSGGESISPNKIIVREYLAERDS